MHNQGLQWNLSTMDTIRTTRTVPITEVSLFQGLICTCTHFCIAGTKSSVLIYREVSLFWRPYNREVPLECIIVIIYC